MKTQEENINLLKAGIEKYGNEIIFDLLDYCINPEESTVNCGDNQCDHEPCRVYMAFMQMIEFGDYKNQTL